MTILAGTTVISRGILVSSLEIVDGAQVNFIGAKYGYALFYYI